MADKRRQRQDAAVPGANSEARNNVGSRRSFLVAGVGFAASLIAACTRSDEEVFAGIVDDPETDPADPATETTGTSESARTDPTEVDGAEADGTEADGTEADAPETDPAETGMSEAEASPADPGGSQGAAAVPAGRDLIIAFTYEQLPGGKTVPPYIAVWIEDEGGDLVSTVSLWFRQEGDGTRWLPDLRRWFGADQRHARDGGADVVDAVSGPTRQPGMYQVAWNGQAAGGGLAPPGTYYVCVESARERGPYSLVREAVSLDGSAVDVKLGSDGELIDLSATLV